ncbi:TVG0869119 [Thermoplasma volcanium GSS1]|uniref:TVG0869119 protein n=1 Tax=Thermoplasma volcanium (strain ATCC 51530 / DSM 4299 / JCM 9571 / NBRC 15438 / GSS1) TaxID=273116 RepID=Q97AG5_THEVO|nr:hypothetical protein [Thermoplasma volcanium]BAB59987.1 TVG0869119 [Thermoplasma volcanium GSS1]
MEDIDSYLNYVNSIWVKINEKFKNQDENVKIAILQLAARPYYYWIQENLSPPPKKEGQETGKLENIVSKYGDSIQIENDTVKIVKRLGTTEFAALRDSLREIGYQYDAQSRGFKKKQ